jgi:hypothetical protein
MDSLDASPVETSQARATFMRRRLVGMAGVGVAIAAAVGVWALAREETKSRVATHASGAEGTEGAVHHPEVSVDRDVTLSDDVVDTNVQSRGRSGGSRGTLQRDSVGDATVVTWRGGQYVCGDVRGGFVPCVRYFGGQPPQVFFGADIWCRWPDALVCVEYDPSQYFEITSRGGRYLCTDVISRGFRCNRYFGGRPSVSLWSADLYCNGSQAYPECSELWYPNELKRYEIVRINGQTHLCNPATNPYASIGDKDCAPYRGGDPKFVSFSLGLKCSPSSLGGSYECRTDYYPSEEKGVVFMEIDYQNYACKKTFSGHECYRYYGGSPKRAMMGMPDYYCNDYGCSPSGYPREY